MSEFKKNEIYAISELSPGDRFYIFGSPGKIPATLIRTEAKPPKAIIHLDGERFEKPISPGKQVVFLRHQK